MNIKRLSDGCLKSLSKVNSYRKKTGDKKENYIAIQLAKFKVKFNVSGKKVRVFISELPGMKFGGYDIDFHLPDKKIFMETTSSISDGKLAKLALQSKGIKQSFPDNKFVTFIFQQPRVGSSFINNIKSCPYVDDVVVIWKDEWKYVKELKQLICDRLKPVLMEK